MTDEQPKKRSDSRKRNLKFQVRVDEEEFDAIKALASNCGLSAPDLLRRLGLGHEPKSVIDQKAFLEVLKLHADMNRVAGLIKLWLSERETKLPSSLGIGVDELRSTVSEIRRLSEEVKNTAKRL